MALKPEPMKRTVIVSSKGRQKDIIETLHGLRLAHINDYTENREGEFAEFRIGRPLAEAEDASAVLVRLRALIRNLDLEDHSPSRSFSIRDLEDALRTRMGEVESEIHGATDERARVSSRLESLRDEAAQIGPLKSLPLRLEDYGGYETVAVFTGFVTQPPSEVEADLRAVVPDYALFAGENNLVAVVVPQARAAAATDVLFKAGFREHPVPEGAGAVDERLAAIESERASLSQQLTRAEENVAALRAKHGDFIVAAEEHLTIEVAKAEAPLSFATTQNAFVIDTWIPASEVSRVESALVRVTDGNVHLEVFDHVAHAMHGVDDIHGGHGRGEAEHEHEHDEKNQPPTRLRNSKFSSQFAFFTEMFSVPKYSEIDPTVVLSLAFPLFFGFMIGDLGLGLVMAGLGYLMFRKLGHIEGLKELGFAILVAGVIAAAIGGLVFKDAFGIPLGSNSHIEHEVEEALHAGGAEGGALGDVEVHAAAASATCDEIYRHVGEATWGCLVSGGSYAGYAEPIIFKITDVQTMLLISIGAALVHLFVGLVFGIKNEWGHSTKHTVAKFGWMALLITFFPAVLALLAADTWTAWTGFAVGTAYMIAGVGFLIGLVVLGWSEGIAGVLEIPSMLSNILSYLRLGAVAIAKGSMAVAFNKMTLVDVGLLGGNAGLLVLGLILFIFVQAILFVLGILSSGIQAIRLNYVEFFTKFYKGGGEKFSPFGHTRRYSTLTAPATGGGKL